MGCFSHFGRLPARRVAGLALVVLSIAACAGGAHGVTGLVPQALVARPAAANTIASIDVRLPVSTLPLGQQMTFAVVAKNAAGKVISGKYGRPISLSAKYLVISPSSVANSTQASQVRAAWSRGFAGSAIGSVTATAEGHATTAKVDPGTGFAFYTVGSNPKTDVSGFHIVAGPDGDIYYAALAAQTCTQNLCFSNDGAIGRFDPATQKADEIEMHAGIFGLLFTSDGALWAAGGYAHKVFRLPPHTFSAGSVEAIPVPAPQASGQTYSPRELTEDGSGNVWFDDLRGGRIFKNPLKGPYDGSVLTPYPMPTGPPGTVQLFAFAGDGIRYGRDGKLYVVDRFNGLVNRVDPATGATIAQIITPQETAYGLTSQGFPAPNFMTEDGKGTLLFGVLGGVTNTSYRGTVDSLTPGASRISAYTLPNAPSGTEVWGIGANGGYAYYVDLGRGLGFIDADTGKSRAYPIASNTQGQESLTPNGVAVLNDGTAWFTCYDDDPPQPLCLGHTIYLSGWSAFPGPQIAISGYGAASSQLVGIMEAPSKNSGPFTATSSSTHTCALSSVKDHNFVITGMANGNCTITIADASHKKAQLQVTVQPSPTPTPN